MELNPQVRQVADARRWRVQRLAVGELVIRLPGKLGAHAGAWGETAWHLFIPCKSPTRRWAIIKASPLDLRGLSNKSGDDELLVVGPTTEILALLTEGPSWCRARRKRAAVPGLPPWLKKTRADGGPVAVETKATPAKPNGALPPGSGPLD